MIVAGSDFCLQPLARRIGVDKFGQGIPKCSANDIEGICRESRRGVVSHVFSSRRFRLSHVASVVMVRRSIFLCLLAVLSFFVSRWRKIAVVCADVVVWVAVVASL